jgi:flagellar biosynthetic protein FliO
MPDINYNPGLASIIFKLIISLAIIIGLIYLTVYFLKRLNNKGLAGNEGMIKIISRSYLTPKQSLYIVKLGGSYSVLGVGESSVNHIKDLSADEVEMISTESIKPKGFQNVLKSVLGK